MPRRSWTALSATASVAIAIYACGGTDYGDEPGAGDANGVALEFAVGGKIYAEAVPASDVEEGPTSRPTPEPTSTPHPVPDQVYVAALTGCKDGQACLTYGLYEPDSGRLATAVFSCAMSDSPGGYHLIWH